MRAAPRTHTRLRFARGDTREASPHVAGTRGCVARPVHIERRESERCSSSSPWLQWVGLIVIMGNSVLTCTIEREKRASHNCNVLMRSHADGRTYLRQRAGVTSTR